MENSNFSGTKKFVSVVVALVLVIGGYFLYQHSSKTIGVLNDKASNVATVNGVVIPKATYDTQLSSEIALYKAQGVDISSDPTKLSQVKKQILDNLISNELLSQAVAAAGIKPDPVEVEKQYQAILSQSGGAEGLKAELVKNNLTDAQLRENISKQVMAQKYLLQNIDIKSVTVSDAEIAQFYADYVKTQKTASSTVKVLALKDLSAQIKQQITSTKEQALIVGVIDALRAKANVVMTP